MTHKKTFTSFRVTKPADLNARPKWHCWVTDSEGRETWTTHRTRRDAVAWGRALTEAN